MSLAIPAHLRSGVGSILPPAEFADAVELYARNHGRHGTLKFVPAINCWVIEFTLKANDPRMQLWKQGRAEEPPMEIVHLWRHNGREYVGYTLDELGVTGMKEFLEKANSWGRGKALSDAVKEQDQKRVDADAKIERDARDDAVLRGMDYRRQALDIPYLPVGIDLPKTPTTALGDE